MPVYINNKEIKDPKDYSNVIKAMDESFMFRKAGWLDKFPRFKQFTVKIGVKLHLIKRYQWFEFKMYGPNGKLLKSTKVYNSVVNVGTQQLGNLMIQANTNTLNNVNIGTSNAATTNTMTDLQAPAAGAGRQVATSRTISGAAPFIITIGAFISGTTYTRPVAVQEIGVFFDPNGGGAMFARAVITTFNLTGTNTATLSYGILLG